MEDKTALSSGAIDSAAEANLAEIARLQLIAARSHRQSAEAMEEAARTLEKRLADAAKAMEAIGHARDRADSEAERLRGRSTALTLGAAQAHAASERCPVAVDFMQVSILTRRFADKAAVQAWRAGERVEMVPEPTNPADPNAIKLMRDGKMVGYVARDDAQVIKERQSQGWTLAGWAFLKAKKGGRWDEGHVMARMENPVMGWPGYNPVESPQSNLARMEADLIGKLIPAPAAPRKRAPSL